MPINRRNFIQAAINSALLASSATLFANSSQKSSRPLEILFLGGTGFLGPHTVRYALSRGHKVTLFNRGKTNSELFPELETIIGNRDPEIDNGLSGLKNRKWDAVIDTSGYVPRIVDASANLLRPNVKQYLFVSTTCRYENWNIHSEPNNEKRPPAKLPENAKDSEDSRKFYCELKAASEEAAENSMPGRVTNIRPGYIVGPGDKTDRFTYWPVRASRGGEILAPGKPDDITQFIDVRDLGQFMVHCLEQSITGPFNLVRPSMAFGDLLAACVKVAKNDARLTWVPADFLEKHDVRAWRDVSMWNDENSDYAGTMMFSPDKALKAGLTYRPIEDTIADTLSWFLSLPDERQGKLRIGMSADKETRVLAAWHKFKNSPG